MLPCVVGFRSAVAVLHCFDMWALISYVRFRRL
jgi:hypothetical protein